MTDFLSSTNQAPPPGGGLAARLTVAPIAAALAVIVVVATGTLAFRAVDGGGEQPERFAPASTFAFAKVDLDPSAGQKLAAYRFSRHFPDAPGASDADEAREKLLASALEDFDELDYQRDVEPWLGKRLGVAAFPGDGREPAVVGILQHTDGAKAAAALRKVATSEDDFAFRVLDDYVLISDDQRVVDEVAEETRESGLSSVDQFNDDIGELDGDAIVTGWLDIEQLAATVSATDDEAPVGALSQTGGRVALAVRAAPEHIEIEGRSFDAAAQPQGEGAGDLLANLPADTMAALSFASLGDALAEQFEASTTGVPGVEDMIIGLEESSGLQLPEDLVTLLGDRAVVAGRFTDGDLHVGVRSHPEDRDEARALLADALRRLDEQSVALADAGDDELVVAFGDGYAERLAADGDLGESELIGKALVDLDSATSAAFFDVQALLEAFLGTGDGEGDRNLRPIKAVGMTTHADGDQQSFRVRIVATG